LNWGIKVLQTTNKLDPVVETSAKKVPPIMKPMKRRNKEMLGVAGVLLVAAGMFLVAKWIKG